jgi:hypothetical protein
MFVYLRSFLLVLCVILHIPAFAQGVWYFGSGEAVNLTNGMAFSNGLKVLSGSLDPSASAVSAPAGSIYQSTNGSVYVKQDAGSSTNWLPVGVAAPSSLSTINGQSGPGVTLAAGSAGTDFGITAAANTITFDIPTASAANRGLLSSANWTTFNNKEPAITATSSADYYRGDKTFQPLNKAAVGLSNVDNTSDANKPVSTATQTALDLKADLASPTFTGTVSGITKAMVGLGNVDNTSDANKPISTATQTALDLKQDIVAGVDSTEIGYLNGVTSGIQGQIDGKEPSFTTLPIAKGGTNNGSLSVTAGKVLYGDGTKVNSTAAGSSNQVLYGGATPAFADPQIAIGSEVNAASNQTQIVLPNAQATVQSGNLTTRIESGNKNLLVNPSFEAGSLFDGWTYTGDATSDFSVSRIDGATSANITATADTFTLTQSSTLYQSQFADGIQGLASMWVKSDHSAACEVCSVQAGTPSTVDCVEVNRDGKWGLYKVPFVLGGTSNGVQLSCDSGSGDTYVDDAYVGAPDIIQDSAAVGPWTAFTPTLSELSGFNLIEGFYRVVGDSIEVRVGFTKNASAGVSASSILFNLPTGYTTNTSKLNASTYHVVGEAWYRLGGAGNNLFGSAVVRGDITGGVSVREAGASTSLVGTDITAATIFYVMFTVPVNELNGNVNTYTAQCGANCEDEFEWQGSAAGAVSGEKIDVVNGSGAVSDTSLFTYTFNAGIFTTAPNCSCSTGPGASQNVQNCQIDSVSSTQVAVRTNRTTIGGSTSVIALVHNVTCSKTGADYKNSRTIVGSFKALDYVAAAATYSGAQSFATATAGIKVVFNEEHYDTHGAFNSATGVFTAPMDGYYTADCGLYFDFALDSGEQIRTTLVIGTRGFYNRQRMAATLTYQNMLIASGTYWMDAGETAYCEMYQNSGASQTLVASSLQSFVIARIPGQQ